MVAEVPRVWFNQRTEHNENSDQFEFEFESPFTRFRSVIVLLVAIVML